MVTAAQIHSFTKYVHFECQQSIYQYTSIFFSYVCILIFIYYNKTYKNKSKNVLQILFIPSHLQTNFKHFKLTLSHLCPTVCRQHSSRNGPEARIRRAQSSPQRPSTRFFLQCSRRSAPIWDSWASCSHCWPVWCPQWQQDLPDLLHK